MSNKDYIHASFALVNIFFIILGVVVLVNTSTIGIIVLWSLAILTHLASALINFYWAFLAE